MEASAASLFSAHMLLLPTFGSGCYIVDSAELSISVHNAEWLSSVHVCSFFSITKIQTPSGSLSQLRRSSHKVEQKSVGGGGYTPRWKCVAKPVAVESCYMG